MCVVVGTGDLDDDGVVVIDGYGRRWWCFMVAVVTVVLMVVPCTDGSFGRYNDCA